MSKQGANGLAILAGAGDLPRLLALHCAKTGVPYTIVGFGNADLDWAGDHPFIAAKFEKAGALFQILRDVGCTKVVFAGSMARPSLNPLQYDMKFAKIAPRLLKALKAGDDHTLRTIAAIFEEEGFNVVAANDILGTLQVNAGVPTRCEPSAQDIIDIKTAIKIVTALGFVDVGQGAIVANGICLGLESIQGTDAMLQFVADTARPYRVDPDGADGVLLKAPKLNQDRRIDMPSIGPETMRNAHAAGLAGVVIAANAALVMDMDETVRVADELGLFLCIKDIA